MISKGLLQTNTNYNLALPRYACPLLILHILGPIAHTRTYIILHTLGARMPFTLVFFVLFSAKWGLTPVFPANGLGFRGETIVLGANAVGFVCDPNQS